MSDKRAANVLRELHNAEKELVGKAVVLTDGKAGTIDHVFLDDLHGLRISIKRTRWQMADLDGEAHRELIDPV
jgi:CHAD domain-containing protein